VSYLLRSIGVSVQVASACQDLISLLLLIVVWRIWADQRLSSMPRMILTVSLSVPTVPYGYAYSLVGLSVAMMVLATSLKGVKVFLAELLWRTGGLYGYSL
jgi:hypothetical protein